MAADSGRRQGDQEVAADLHLFGRILLVGGRVEHDGNDGGNRAEVSKGR